MSLRRILAEEGLRKSAAQRNAPIGILPHDMAVGLNQAVQSGRDLMGNSLEAHFKKYVEYHLRRNPAVVARLREHYGDAFPKLTRLLDSL
jgi:hypothetical protein